MIHIIQNDPRVPPGTCITNLERIGDRYRIVRLFEGEPLPPMGDPIIVLGGAMGVCDTDKHPFLAPLMEFMAEAAEEDTPLLGICLGGQLLAAALGAQVHARVRGERGVHTVTATASGAADPLLAGLSETFPAFQWHGDSFEIPSSAVHLASSKQCPGQIFRHKRAYGLQFHPEVDESMVADWVRLCAADPDHIAQFKNSRDRLDRIAANIFENFLDLARG